MLKPKTPKQNRTLNYLLTEAGLDGDTLRDYLESICGKRYRRDMDFYDFQKVIKDLCEKNSKSMKTTYQTPAVKRVAPKDKLPALESDPISREQTDLIFKLHAQAGAVSSKAQAGITRKTIGKIFPVTIGDGKKMIEALKAINARGGLKKTPGDSENKKNESGRDT